MKTYEVAFVWGAVVEADSKEKAIDKAAKMLINLNSKELSGFGVAYDEEDISEIIAKSNKRSK